MIYSLVTPEGTVIKSRVELDVPPELPALKGRWLPDNVPEYDRRLYSLRRVEPVPASAVAIEYALDPVPIATAKSVARDMVTEQRQVGVESGFTYMGKTLDSNQTSALNIIGAALAAQIAAAQGVPFNVTWTCADNTYLELDAQQTMGMMVEFAKHVDAYYAAARARKDAISGVNTSSIDDILALTK